MHTRLGRSLETRGGGSSLPGLYKNGLYEEKIRQTNLVRFDFFWYIITILTLLWFILETYPNPIFEDVLNFRNADQVWTLGPRIYYQKYFKKSRKPGSVFKIL